MKQLLAAFALCAMLFTACNSNDTNQTGGEKTVDNVFSAPDGKYRPEEGVINYTYSMAGMQGEQIIKFRDHGEEELIEIQMDMMGQKMTTYTLSKDGYVYTWSANSNEGMKMKPSESEKINYRDIPDSIRTKLNIKETGTEELLGKTAKIFSMSDTESGMQGTTSVWEGIPLKSVMEIQGNKVQILATKFDENPTLNEKDFEIPANINFREF